MASTDEIASAGTYLSKDKGVEVTDGTQVRVTLGVINSTTGADGSVTPIDYGLRVVSSDGTTVIIDGTSDVFRISASGTQTVTATTGTQAVVSVSLSGLGTFSATPAALIYTSDTNDVAGLKSGPFMWTANLGTGGRLFAAATSGGAVTTAFSAVVGYVWGYMDLDLSNFAEVNLVVANAAAVSYTRFSKYYVLAQKAM